MTKKAYTIGSKTFTKEIVYDKTKINKVIDSAGGTAQYEYDSMGRISKEKDSSGNILKSYTYDSYGQLIRENNKALDKTFVYEYNNIGNITKVKEYAYTTSSTPTLDESTIEKSSFRSQQARTWNLEKFTVLTAVPH